MVKVDLTGEEFGHLTVMKEDGHVGKKVAWLCRCVCGGLVRVSGSNLRSGNTNSCGCYRKIKTSITRSAYLKEDAATRDPLYTTWKGMITRCTNPGSVSYPNYGGRGISVCEKWLHSFYDFRQDMGPRPEGYTLDRIDNDGDYHPENCKWSSREEQMSNTRRSRGGL